MIRAMQPDAVRVQRRGSRRALGGQRARHRGRPVLGELRSRRRRWRAGVARATCAPRNRTSGQRHASKWLPAECDVSIRPGWFWHEAENARVKKPAQLINLYYQSVGRGATLLLNVPPNRDGLLSPEDVASLQGFGAYLRATFAQNLAAQRQGGCHARARQRQAVRPRAPAGRPRRHLLGHRR